MSISAIDTLVPYPEDGDDAVVYRLVTNVSSIKIDSSGNFSQSKVSVAVMRRVGSNPMEDITDSLIDPEKTTEGLYVYLDVKHGATATTTFGVATELDINTKTCDSTATSIEFTLVEAVKDDSGEVVESIIGTASVMIMRDEKGEKGDDAVMYYLIATSTAVSVKDDVCTPSSVIVSVMRKVGDETAQDITESLGDYNLMVSRKVDDDAEAPLGNFTTTIKPAWSTVTFALKTLSDYTLLDTLTVTVKHEPIRYYLTASATNVIVFNGVCSPSTITVQAFKQVGSDAPVDITSQLIVAANSSNTDGLYVQWVAGSVGGGTISSANTTLTLKKTYPYVTLQLYLRSSSKDILIDTLNVAIKGYSQLRGPQDWTSLADGYAFQSGGAGDDYKDCVYYDGLYYSCIGNHSKSSSSTPKDLAAANKYWQVADQMEMVATQVLLAKYGVIYFLQGNQLLIKDGNGKVCAGMAGTDIPIWAGSEDATKAPFQVDINGKMTATNADIIGKFQAIANNKNICIDPATGKISIFDTTVAGKETELSSEVTTDLEGLYSTTTSRPLWPRAISGSIEESNNYVADLGNDNKTVSERKLIGSLETTEKTSFVVTGTLTVACDATKKTNAPATMNAGITVYLRRYSQAPTGEDADSNFLLDEVQLAVCERTTVNITGNDDSTVSESATLALNHSASIEAGYIAIELEISGEMQGSGLLNYTWTDLNGTYAGVRYVSRYFANGFCLGQAANNYVAAFLDGNGNMSFVAQNPSYGFQVTSEGLQYHVGGEWKKLV